MVGRCLVGILVLALGLLGGQAAAQTSLDETLSRDCGVTSLYTLLRLNAVDVDLAHLRATLPAPGPEGLSMADLQAGARTQGVVLRGRRLGPTALPLDRAQIALLQPPGAIGHFVVLRPVGTLGRSVLVLDFPRPPRVLAYADLLRSNGWTGLVLAPLTTGERFGPPVGMVLGGLLIVVGVARPVWRR